MAQLKELLQALTAARTLNPEESPPTLQLQFHQLIQFTKNHQYQRRERDDQIYQAIRGKLNFLRTTAYKIFEKHSSLI
jgi:hypothetical protein